MDPAPAMRHTRKPDVVRGMNKRQVTVENPDGSRTVHTFWTDADVMPHWMARPDDAGGLDA